MERKHLHGQFIQETFYINVLKAHTYLATHYTVHLSVDYVEVQTNC